MNTFASRYASMPEDELKRLADDVRNLVPEAKEALRAEFERRNLPVEGINWKAYVPLPPPPRTTTLVGDAAGEYLEMERGKYHAWVHVAIAFTIEVIVLAFLVTKGLDLLFPTISWMGIGVGSGSLITLWVYWDRWRCIEAYTSRWCLGVLGASLLGGAPIVALIYANYRGFRKFKRR